MINRNVIYCEHQDVFFKDILLNKVAAKMQTAVENQSSLGPSFSEFRSWHNSPKAVKNLIELSGLKDLYVTFEYQVPYTQKRIDCMLYGKNNEGKGQVVHIELKQWDSVQATSVEGNFVETYTGRPNNLVAHPSQQVKGYHEYLLGFVEVFEEDNMGLFGCAYCHNYTKIDGQDLYDPIYNEVIKSYPVYSGNNIEELAEKLKLILIRGEGLEIFNKFMSSPVKPSKKLLESASKIVANNSDFTLLNDQIVARNAILSKVRKARKNGEKSVVIIKGGPGTGKTVIALHILAEIAAAKNKRSVFFSTKSKPLLEGVKNMLGRGNGSKLLFTNLNQFIPSRVDENSIDVLIIDEAHRIGTSPNHQYTKAIDRTELSQVEILIRASKTSVFFIDDKQIIRSAEIGSTDLIREFAKKYECTIEEVDLVSQFRCSGSDNYLDWVENVLYNGEEDKKVNFQDSYDFQVFDSPSLLYSKLSELNNKEKTTARLVAGFCWEWSKSLDADGNLIPDVKIGDFEMPWETHGDINRPPEGYVKWYEWAYKPEGVKQVGCIYTAQGFEFDYIGVIIGNDLKYDPIDKCLKTDINATMDPTLRRKKDSFDSYVRNIYRVLMSRGIKGCYIYCTDKATSEYFRSLLNIS